MKSTLTKRGLHVKSSGYKVQPHPRYLSVSTMVITLDGTSLSPFMLRGSGITAATPLLLPSLQILFQYLICFLSFCINWFATYESPRTCLSSDGQVIHVTGRIRCRPALVPGSTRSVRRPMGLVALAHTLPPSTLNEVRMESHMFVFRVNMDLQVIYCENR